MAWKRVTPDDAKLKELVLYIARKSEGDPRFGSTKLNKLLFLADFIAYATWGQPITGQDYMAENNGPVPRRLLPVREQMEKAGELVIAEVEYQTKLQKRPIALREPDVGIFTGPEIALVDSLIEDWWEHTATAISMASHEFVGWRVAQKGETIPYETALLDDRDLTKDEEARGLELVPAARKLLGHT